MKTKWYEVIASICDCNGWNFYCSGEKVELSQNSSLGIEIIITLGALGESSFVAALSDYAQTYSAEEEASNWHSLLGREQFSFSELLDDMKGVKASLSDLADKLIKMI
jgi:hypothetical protein